MQAAERRECDTAFDLGSKAVAAGDLSEARTQALRAAAVCVEDQRGKADTLQGAIAAAEKTDDACLRSFRAIESQVEDGRPGRARSSFGKLSAACAAKPAAADLRKQLLDTQAAERAAQADVRSALDERDAARAKAALERLSGVNRDNSSLAGFKREVDALAAAPSEPAARVVEEGLRGDPRTPTAPVAARAPDRPAPAAARDSGSTESNRSMAGMFLRDAEQALLQRKFDAARTYVDSARRIDPNNPRLESLMQQIRDQERQMLQQETTIR